MLIKLRLLDGEHQRFPGGRRPVPHAARRANLSENLQDRNHESALQAVTLSLDISRVTAAMSNLHLRPGFRRHGRRDLLTDLDRRVWNIVLHPISDPALQGAECLLARISV